MTDLPISHSQSVNIAGIAAAFTRLTVLFRTSCGELAQACRRNAPRKAMRRTPEEILAAQARREEARRVADQLWLRR